MFIQVTKKDLRNMIKGTIPTYTQMELPIIAANGSYTGGFSDKWTWNLSKDLTEDQLLEIYNALQ